MADSAQPTLGEVVDLLHTWYPPGTADSWDAVGLAAGDPAAPVSRVMFAVDPTPEVAEDAVAWGADLLVTHHPLLLTPVHGMAATTPKGRTLHTLVTAGCGLLTAHTNADQAVSGVSEAMATALGLTDLAPIVPAPGVPLDKLVVFVPHDAADRVRAALAEAGAGRIGDYDSCSWSGSGEGRFRPLDGARPAIGAVGDLEVVPEARVETVLPRSLRSTVLGALRAAHPYEEPAFDLVELADPRPATTGTGRVGTLRGGPVTLRAFGEQVAAALPETAHGVRVAGEPDRAVERVAVCGGAGDFLLERMVHADADVYVTSDLRHHRAAEFLEESRLAGGPALVDVAHWAAEWTWLPVVEARLAATLAEQGRGDTVSTQVSARCTDPWTFRT